jgi:uncharacterized integral membrane protein
MIKALRILLGLAGLIVIVAFAIANRTPVEVGFAPLPIVIELPLYGVFLLGLVVGGLLGGIAVWLAGAKHRLQARRTRNQVRALEKQVAVLNRQAEGAREGYPAGRSMAAQGAAA